MFVLFLGGEKQTGKKEQLRHQLVQQKIGVQHYDMRREVSTDMITEMVTEIVVIIPGFVPEV